MKAILRGKTSIKDGDAGISGGQENRRIERGTSHLCSISAGGVLMTELSEKGPGNEVKAHSRSQNKSALIPRNVAAVARLSLGRVIDCH